MSTPTIPATQSITFAVDDVPPAQLPLAQGRMHQAIRKMLKSEIESCSDYHQTVIDDVDYHPLLAAVYIAFSQHRPLVLTPDAIWITITQGIAHHMAIHCEELRSRLVSHKEKLTLNFETRDWVEGSPENPWPQAFDSWTTQIRDHVGHNLHDLLLNNFGTTTPIDRAVSQICMMDIFERYFHYRAYCICGIPTVTLEGAPADWQKLAEKVARLRIFNIDWWIDHLIPICNQFLLARKGQVDLNHWQNICKLREEYGGHIVNGWIAKLFPYLRAFINGPCTRPNPIFETGEGFQTLDAPSGLSSVPFTWSNLLTDHTRYMEAIGGFGGISQHPQTLALRPVVAWAVRAVSKFDSALNRLVKEHTTFPGQRTAKLDQRGWPIESGLPEDFARFYHRTNGAKLECNGVRADILPFGQIEPLDSGEHPQPPSRGGFAGRIWTRFAWLTPDTWLAINLDVGYDFPLANDSTIRSHRSTLKDLFAPIFIGSGKSNLGVPPSLSNIAQNSPVIALSFTELLERLLADTNHPYWQSPTFTPYGRAEQFTRPR